MDRLVLLQMKVSQTLQSVLCITIDKYLVRVLVVLLHALFSIFWSYTFSISHLFFLGYPYVESTTVLPLSVIFLLVLMLAIIRSIPTMRS